MQDDQNWEWSMTADDPSWKRRWRRKGAKRRWMKKWGIEQTTRDRLCRWVDHNESKLIGAVHQEWFQILTVSESPLTSTNKQLYFSCSLCFYRWMQILSHPNSRPNCKNRIGAFDSVRKAKKIGWTFARSVLLRWPSACAKAKRSPLARKVFNFGISTAYTLHKNTVWVSVYEDEADSHIQTNIFMRTQQKLEVLPFSSGWSRWAETTISSSLHSSGQIRWKFAGAVLIDCLTTGTM